MDQFQVLLEETHISIIQFSVGEITPRRVLLSAEQEGIHDLVQRRLPLEGDQAFLAGLELSNVGEVEGVVVVSVPIIDLRGTVIGPNDAVAMCRRCTAGCVPRNWRGRRRRRRHPLALLQRRARHGGGQALLQHARLQAREDDRPGSRSGVRLSSCIFGRSLRSEGSHLKALQCGLEGGHSVGAQSLSMPLQGRERHMRLGQPRIRAHLLLAAARAVSPDFSAMVAIHVSIRLQALGHADVAELCDDLHSAKGHERVLEAQHGLLVPRAVVGGDGHGRHFWHASRRGLAKDVFVLGRLVDDDHRPSHLYHRGDLSLDLLRDVVAPGLLVESLGLLDLPLALALGVLAVLLQRHVRPALGDPLDASGALVPDREGLRTPSGSMLRSGRPWL